MIVLRSKKTKKGYSLYLDIYYKGERRFEFLRLYTSKDCTTQKPKRIDNPNDKQALNLANEILLQRQYEFIKGGYQMPKKPIVTNLMQYLEKISEKKGNNYISFFKHFKQFIGKDSISFDKINNNFFLSFQDYLKDKGLSNTSIYHYMNRFFILLREGTKEGVIPEMDFNVEIVKEDEKEPIYLTLEELQKMIDCNFKLNPHDRYGFIFACFTGLRYSDISKIKWSDIENGVLSFVPTKTRNIKKHNHHIPILEQANNVLNLIPKKEGTEEIFWDISTSKITTQVKKWANAAGIKKNITFHTSRHTMAMLAMASEVDIYSISKILGHSDIKTTEIYAQMSANEKRNAMMKIPKIAIK